MQHQSKFELAFRTKIPTSETSEIRRSGFGRALQALLYGFEAVVASPVSEKSRRPDTAAMAMYSFSVVENALRLNWVNVTGAPAAPN